eukprot:SM000021S06495  [mRNA]  locus=s21:602796:605822:- [translate_table: standard]
MPQGRESGKGLVGWLLDHLMATLLHIAKAVHPASILVDTGQTSSPVVEAGGHAESLVETARVSSGAVEQMEGQEAQYMEGAAVAGAKEWPEGL